MGGFFFADQHQGQEFDPNSLFDSYNHLEIEELNLHDDSIEVPDAPVQTPKLISAMPTQDPNQEKSIFERCVQVRKFNEEGTLV